MFAAAETIGLFPSFLQRSRPLDGGPAALQALIDAVVPHLPAPDPQRPAPRRRSRPDLQNLPALQPLVGQLTAWIGEAMAQAAQKPQACVISALWAEVAAIGWGEHPRLAPNAHMTFYLPLAAPQGISVQITDPRPQAQVIVPMVSEPNEYNAREVTIPLGPGQVLLAPGWLPQGLQVPGDQPGEILLLRGQSLFSNMDRAISPPMWTGMTRPIEGTKA
ncbi:MAG: hypothetical protein AAFY02_12975 [Pseudomonadota bacterium]